MIETEDRYIIQKCLNGETEAFGFLVDRYKQSVYALAHSKLQNSHDAEDITQKVFIKAYQKLRTLKQWDNMHAWLYSITANMCKDWIKIQSRRPDRSFIEDQDPKTIESITADTQDDPMIETLNEALESLPEIYRQVLTLYYLGDRDNKEIARFLGISPESVRQRLTRARSLLKEEIIAMMGRTFETQRLPIGFTFRIIEAVKRIKIDPVSIGKGVPWGLSLATGLLIAILGLNPQFMKMVQVDLTNLAVSGESSVLETGDFPVDIAKISEEPFLAKPEGANNGKSASDNPLVQNAFLLAPQAEGGTWEKKPDMITALFGLSACAVNGKIYIIGGCPNNNINSPTVEEYDPVTGQWTRKADMLTSRAGFATAIVNGKIYVIGGWQVTWGAGFSTVEEYDPVIDKWTKKADMPTPRTWLSAAAVNGKIYAIGGWTGLSPFFSTVEEYDPSKDKWTKKADMPTPTAIHSASELNGKIYIMGGRSPGPGGVVDVTNSTVEEYDPIRDEWTSKANMSTTRYFLSSSVANGKIYAIGGSQDVQGKILSLVEEYDSVEDKWTEKADMPTARFGHTSCVVDNKIYAIGGTEAWLGLDVVEKPIPTVEEYTPEGWQAVSLQGKLQNTWGEVKTK